MPTRSPAAMSCGVSRVKGLKVALFAQFGWYHGFLRPIVDGEVYFFCPVTRKGVGTNNKKF